MKDNSRVKSSALDRIVSKVPFSKKIVLRAGLAIGAAATLPVINNGCGNITGEPPGSKESALDVCEYDVAEWTNLFDPSLKFSYAFHPHTLSVSVPNDSQGNIPPFEWNFPCENDFSTGDATSDDCWFKIKDRKSSEGAEYGGDWLVRFDAPFAAFSQEVTIRYHQNGNCFETLTDGLNNLNAQVDDHENRIDNIEDYLNLNGGDNDNFDNANFNINYNTDGNDNVPVNDNVVPNTNGNDNHGNFNGNNGGNDNVPVNDNHGNDNGGLEEKIACEYDIDCGETEILSGRYCDDNNVFEDVKYWSCEGTPGTTDSYCASQTDQRFVEGCGIDQICNSGACESVPESISDEELLYDTWTEVNGGDRNDEDVVSSLTGNYVILNMPQELNNRYGAPVGFTAQTDTEYCEVNDASIDDTFWKSAEDGRVIYETPVFFTDSCSTNNDYFTAGYEMSLGDKGPAFFYDAAQVFIDDSNSNDNSN